MAWGIKWNRIESGEEKKDEESIVVEDHSVEDAKVKADV